MDVNGRFRVFISSITTLTSIPCCCKMVPSKSGPNLGMTTRLKICSRGERGSMNNTFWMGRAIIYSSPNCTPDFRGEFHVDKPLLGFLGQPGRVWIL